MAVTQTLQDKGGLGIGVADSGGYYYVQFGSVRLYKGSGSPDATITAPWGSLYIEVDAAAYTLWVNVDSATEWKYATLT